jgi:hypothetical protein
MGKWACEKPMNFNPRGTLKINGQMGQQKANDFGFVVKLRKYLYGEPQTWDLVKF